MAEENNKKSIFRLTDYDNGIDNDWRDRIEKLREETYGEKKALDKALKVKYVSCKKTNNQYTLKISITFGNLASSEATLMLLNKENSDAIALISSIKENSKI